MLLESAVFWLSFALIAYAYAGYPVLLALLPPKTPVRCDLNHRVPVSIIMAVRNEEQRLAAKLQNLAALHYSPELLQIVVVSDGSQDRTNQYLLEHAAAVTSVLLPESVGKAAALNHAVGAATGDVLVFMDVRQVVDPDAVRQLVACFADPDVGAVSGELHLEDEDGRPSSEALGVYWKLEKLVRKLESSTGSVVGVTGAIFAMRRELFLPLPAGTLLDDVLTPLHVARTGKRVLFLETAVARDRLFVEPGKEFGRKVRTLTGNYSTLR